MSIRFKRGVKNFLGTPLIACELAPKEPAARGGIASDPAIQDQKMKAPGAM